MHSRCLLDDGVFTASCYRYHARGAHDLVWRHGLSSNLQELLEGKSLLYSSDKSSSFLHSATSSSISDSPISSAINSSSSDSPLCTSISPSLLFHSRLKTYLFHKSYPPYIVSLLSPGLPPRTIASTVSYELLGFCFSLFFRFWPCSID